MFINGRNHWELLPGAWAHFGPSGKTTSGTEITDWNDLSGNSRNLTALCPSGERPTIITAGSGINGFEGALFDNTVASGYQTIMTNGIGAPSFFTGYWALFMVVKMLATDPKRALFANSNTGFTGNNPIYCAAGASLNTRLGIAADNCDQQDSDLSFSVGESFVVSWTGDPHTNPGGDGNLLNVITRKNLDVSSADSLTLGCAADREEFQFGTTRGCAGVKASYFESYEMVLYRDATTQLTDSQVMHNMRSLMDKYALGNPN